MFRTLLLPHDLAAGSERAVARVARLPLSRDARVTLLHVVPKALLPRGTTPSAEKDALEALRAIAKQLARSLPRGATVTPVVKTGAPAAEIARQARAIHAELIVVGRGVGRTLRDAFVGSTAERVIRQSRFPVLLVRLPARAPYRRPVLALDLDRAAEPALATALRILPTPRPRLGIVHAYDTPYRGLIYPSLESAAAEEYREHHRSKAFRTIDRWVQSAIADLDAREPGFGQVPTEIHVRDGSPRLVVQKWVEKRRADLLVLGTHGYSGLAHAFLGTVAGDVLRAVACDVLVVPPRAS